MHALLEVAPEVTWLSMRIADGNVVVVPENDMIEHSMDQHCVCAPHWGAHWHEGQGVAGWIFTHQPLDPELLDEASEDGAR